MTFVSSIITIIALFVSSSQDTSKKVIAPIDSAAIDSLTIDRVSLKKSIPKIFPPKTKVINVAFDDGEELTFRIRYGFITAGTAKMMVSVENYDSLKKPVYHLMTTARSASAFSWIYEVKDVVSSYVDMDYFYPIRFEKRLREGGYNVDLFTDYLPDSSLAKVENILYTSSMKIKKKSMYDVIVPPYSQDVLSSFYYIRLKDLNVGESVFLTNHEKKKVYNMEVIVHRKETIEVEAGIFKCIVVEPVVKGEGLFQKKGRLRVWLTDDERKIPVQMKSEVFIGDITTELTKIKGVKGKIKAQKK